MTNKASRKYAPARRCSQGPPGPKGDTGATGPAGPSGQVGVGGYQGFTSDSTFTVPAGVTHILVEAWGAGGSTAAYDFRTQGLYSQAEGGTYVRTTIAVTPGDILTIHPGRGVYGAGEATTVKAPDQTILVDAPGGNGREQIVVNGRYLYQTVASPDTVVGGTSTLTLGQQPPYGSLLPSVFSAAGAPFVNSQPISSNMIYGSRQVQFSPPGTSSCCFYWTQWLGGNGEADVQW